MPKRAKNSYLSSPLARMYLVVGIAMLVSIVLLYLALSGPNSALTSLKSRPMPILVLWTLTAILVAWLRARDPRLRAGLFFKSFGSGLIIFAVSAVLLFDDPEELHCLLFCLALFHPLLGRYSFARHADGKRRANFRTVLLEPNRKSSGSLPVCAFTRT
jgi:FtsH-binding integral membrane protein